MGGIGEGSIERLLSGPHSFNGKLRDELLNGELFYTLREAQVLIEQWRIHYNTIRPHSALGYRPPAQFAMRAKELERSMSFPTAEN